MPVPHGTFTFFDSPRLTRLVTIALILFAGCSLILFFYQSITVVNKLALIDLTGYIKASKRFFSDINPYLEGKRRFIYPLFLLIIVYPLQSLVTTPLGKSIAAAIWSCGAFTTFFLTVAASWKYLYGQTQIASLRYRIVQTAILVVMLHPFLQDEFLNGQTNLFVIGALCAFYLFSENQKELWAGFFLAIAAALKIAPAFCLAYVLFTKQWRTIGYFVFFFLLFTLGIPLLINAKTVSLYQYYINDVMPSLTALETLEGFRSFSLPSTAGHLFGFAWSSTTKVIASACTALLLWLPIWLRAKDRFTQASASYKFTCFSAIIATLPLAFPMSEAHHLLLLTMPFMAVIAYWEYLISMGKSPLNDKLTLLLLLSIFGLHVGHGLKEIPLRCISLIGVYVCMLELLKQKRTTDAETPHARP